MVKYTENIPTIYSCIVTYTNNISLRNRIVVIIVGRGACAREP